MGILIAVLMILTINLFFEIIRSYKEKEHRTTTHTVKIAVFAILANMTINAYVDVYKHSKGENNAKIQSRAKCEGR